MNENQQDTQDNYPSPRLFMFLVAASIFTVETAIMFILGRGQISKAWFLDLLDAIILTLILLPALYYLMYRPFKAQIDKRYRMALQAKMNNELLGVIVEAQREFIAHGKEAALFDRMLERFVLLTRSRCGCVMEVRPRAEGMELFVRSAVGQCAGEVSCEGEQARERRFTEDVVIKGAPVMIPAAARGQGAYLGIPLYSEERIIGVISVSGAEEAYTDEIVTLMQPFVDTCAGLLEACRAEAHRIRNEERLKAAREQAEEALRIKDRFVSLVAHDLKEPLGAILLSLNYLQREAAIPPHRDKLVGYMTRTAQEILHLVDELLVQGRIHMGKIAPRVADAYALTIAGVAIARVEGQAAAKGVRLRNEVPDDLLLQCDPELITEVVVNFLVNAVKFTAAGGSVTVFASTNGDTALAVRDTGVGLDPAEIDELLTPGAFISSEGTEGEKGTGFGIPLCLEILKAHGGELHIESEKGKGSTFLITGIPKRISSHAAI